MLSGMCIYRRLAQVLAFQVNVGRHKTCQASGYQSVHEKSDQTCLLSIMRGSVCTGGLDIWSYKYNIVIYIVIMSVIITL
jgi:hypothetical protein